ncbi:MAG: M48 family metalloprotease [Bryobacterales bacterium]|nr:M48 family metalloprotease [Bryobacterales bacterium]
MRIAALMLVLSSAAFAQDPFSDEKARVIGNHLAEDLRRQMPPLQNAALDEYVQSVVQRLGAAYAFEMLDSSRQPDVTEPLPLPAGRVLIPSATFLAVQDEAELAALLAHAAGHLDAGHAKPRAIAAGAIPLLFWGSIHQDSRGRAVMMLPLALRPIQEEREREADARAIEILTRAGYDASALRVHLARTLKPDEPATDARLAPLPTRAAEATTVTTSAFTRAQDTVRALQPPPPTTRARRGPPTLRWVTR